MRYLLRFMIVVSMVLAVASCATQRNRAILKLESKWKEENNRILQSEGRRFFKAAKQQGFIASQLAARQLGMVVEEQNYETGFMLVTSQAPVPLTMSEWEMVQKSDTKKMRAILADEVGIIAWFATLDPSAKELLVNIFVTEKGEGVEVSAGLRLRDKKVASARIRRMEPPPTAVRMGLHKFWTAFEQELGLLVEKETTSGPEIVTSRSDRKPVSPTKGVIPLVKQSGENPDAVAVIIGNKNYTDRVPTVDFAHNDAEAMKRFLVEILGVRESNVIDLRDVTLAEMEVVFGNDRTHKGQLWRWVRPGESDVFVFYSGHGVPGSKDGRQYLLPVDGDPDAPEIHGYPVELLYRNLNQLKGRSVTVFMDTCFSGESPRGPLLRKASGIRVMPKEAPSAPFAVLSASSKDQLASWDNEAKQGLFTKHLLEALYGAADDKRYGNSDGRITLSEIKGYLDREMTYAARRHYGRDQQATVIGDPEKVIVILNK